MKAKAAITGVLALKIRSSRYVPSPKTLQFQSTHNMHSGSVAVPIKRLGDSGDYRLKFYSIY